jgi:alanyl-tRNA synthetase
MTEQLYLDQPLRLDFTADVIETYTLPDRKTAVFLPCTYFYPTSGGQEHDTGTIGEAVVLDVYKNDSNRIIHVLDRGLTPGRYPAHVNRDRRLRAMQHHTGQHILSAAFLHILNLESVSANIHAYTPSTLDLDAYDVTQMDLQRVEGIVNELIFENRPVRCYFITEAEVASIPFRKPPKVTGRIRVVEVDGYDYTPCGGTHCLQTGSIGLLKIVRTEHINRKLLLHFVTGLQALDTFRIYADTAQQTALLLNTRPEIAGEAVQRLLEQVQKERTGLELLRSEALEMEARRLVDEAESIGKIRLVMRLYPGRSAAETRMLAGKLSTCRGVVAVLASHDEKKHSLVVSAGPDCGVDARHLLDQHIAPFGGRGGGDAVLAQGGGAFEESALTNLFVGTKAWISSQS